MGRCWNGDESTFIVTQYGKRKSKVYVSILIDTEVSMYLHFVFKELFVTVWFWTSTFSFLGENINTTHSIFKLRCPSLQGLSYSLHFSPLAHSYLCLGPPPFISLMAVCLPPAEKLYSSSQFSFAKRTGFQFLV